MKKPKSQNEETPGHPDRLGHPGALYPQWVPKYPVFTGLSGNMLVTASVTLPSGRDPEAEQDVPPPLIKLARGRLPSPAQLVAIGSLLRPRSCAQEIINRKQPAVDPAVLPVCAGEVLPELVLDALWELGVPYLAGCRCKNVIRCIHIEVLLPHGRAGSAAALFMLC